MRLVSHIYSISREFLMCVDDNVSTYRYTHTLTEKLAALKIAVAMLAVFRDGLSVRSQKWSSVD